MSHFTIGVFAIIFDQQKRVLLCHRRDHDLWNLPGGGLETGEAPWQGVVREVKEEVGLEVAVVDLAGVYSKPQQNEIVFSFICQIVGGKLTPSSEADRIAYFAFDQIPPNTLLKHMERIKDALDGLDKTILKIQPGPSTVSQLK